MHVRLHLILSVLAFFGNISHALKSSYCALMIVDGKIKNSLVLKHIEEKDAV